MCYIIGLQPHSVCLCSSAEKWTDGVERTWLKIQTTNNLARKHDYVVFSALLHLDGHRKHLKLSLLDVVFITYNLTVVISPNPIRSIINPACIWVWCNLYKHFSTKVTCAEVTGLHICSRSSCMYCQGASECLYGIMCTRARSHYSGWLLQRQVTYSPFESVKATAFDSVNSLWSRTVCSEDALSSSSPYDAVEISSTESDGANALSNKQLRFIQQTDKVSFKAFTERTQESRCAQPCRNHTQNWAFA